MSIKLSDLEDVYLMVYRKLAFGEWVIMVGESDAVSKIENAIYPPGTTDNADFEAVFGSRKYFFMAKKTPNLHALLKLEGNADAWDSLFAIKVIDLGGRNVLLDTRHFKRIDEREGLLESVIKALVDEMGGNVS